MWPTKKKTKEEDHDYTLFMLPPEEFDKIENAIENIGYYKHFNKICSCSIIVLWITVKKSEEFQIIVESKGAIVSPVDMKVLLENKFRKEAYCALYKRMLKTEIESILNKIAYDKGAAIRDKIEIDRKIKDILKKVDEVSTQFNSQKEFRVITEDKDMDMTLEEMCAKMRQFRGTKF